jgi:hypothetical protein
MIDTLAEELLEQAENLLTMPPNQANLRRSVSAAYYSVFHLLVRAASKQWSDPLYQARIGRLFEHGRMKKVAAEVGKRLVNTNRGDHDLAIIVEEFIRLQEARHYADYNLANPLSESSARQFADAAKKVFVAWQRTQGTKEAREFLFSMLFRERDLTERV